MGSRQIVVAVALTSDERRSHAAGQPKALMTIRSAGALDLVITDDRLDPAVVAAFRSAGVNLQVVPGVADASDPEAD